MLYPSDCSDGYGYVLNGLFDGTRTQAAGADLHPGHGTRFRVYDPQCLEVGMPDFFRLVVCVTDAVSNSWSFTTDLTKSRHNVLLSRKTGCFSKLQWGFLQVFFAFSSDFLPEALSVFHQRRLPCRLENPHPQVPFCVDLFSGCNRLDRQMDIFSLKKANDEVSLSRHGGVNGKLSQ